MAFCTVNSVGVLRLGLFVHVLRVTHWVASWAEKQKNAASYFPSGEEVRGGTLRFGARGPLVFGLPFYHIMDSALLGTGVLLISRRFDVGFVRVPRDVVLGGLVPLV